MLGKISRLPHALREQVNQRLADGQPEDIILPWLNSLPEVQACLKQFFEGQPISPTNLSQYKKHGFRQWQIRQSALEFVSDAVADSPPLNQLASGPLVDHLVDWVSLRYAAAAQSSPVPEDPEADLRDLRAFLADIVALRRGELLSRRIHLEQQRLDHEQAKSQQALEKLFWQWTNRPDIKAKLSPQRDPDKLRRDVVRLIDHQLLGVPHTSDHELDPDPACLV